MEAVRLRGSGAEVGHRVYFGVTASRVLYDVARGLRPGVGEMFVRLVLVDVEGCFKDTRLSDGDVINQRRLRFSLLFLEMGGGRQQPTQGPGSM